MSTLLFSVVIPRTVISTNCPLMSLVQVMVKVKAGISRLDTLFGWSSRHEHLLLLSPCTVAVGASSSLCGLWSPRGQGERMRLIHFGS